MNKERKMHQSSKKDISSYYFVCERKLTLHSCDVGALDVVLELRDLLLKLVEGDKIILCRR